MEQVLLSAEGVALDGRGGQIPAFLKARDKARAGGLPLAGAGSFGVDGYMDASRVKAPLPDLAFTAKDNLAASLPGGVAIDIGGAGEGRFAKTFTFHGRKEKQPKPFTAFRILDDKRPGTTYDLGVFGHFGPALEVTGDSEKKTILLDAKDVDGPLVRMRQSASGSPDSHRITILGASCRRWWECQGSTSAYVDFAVENSLASDQPTIMVGTEKLFMFSGEIRSQNGPVLRVFRGDGPKAGAVVFNGPTFIDSNRGVVAEIVNPRQVSGFSTFNGCGDKSFKNLFPVFWWHNVAGGGSFDGVFEDSYSGLKFGDAAGRAEIPSDSGKIQQRTLGANARFNGVMMLNAPAIAAGVPAAVFDNTNGFTADFWALAGTIQFNAKAQRTTVYVPGAWARAYKAVKDPAATVDLVIRGAVTSAELRAMTWAFDGVRAECVSDLGGVPASFKGGRWASPPAMPWPA